MRQVRSNGYTHLCGMCVVLFTLRLVELRYEFARIEVAYVIGWQWGDPGLTDQSLNVNLSLFMRRPDAARNVDQRCLFKADPKVLDSSHEDYSYFLRAHYLLFRVRSRTPSLRYIAKPRWHALCMNCAKPMLCG